MEEEREKKKGFPAATNKEQLWIQGSGCGFKNSQGTPLYELLDLPLKGGGATCDGDGERWLPRYAT